MSNQPEIMKTPKSYWVTRRVEGHSEWGFGFWRELFQNSVDAGSKKIYINIDDEKGKGSFGREATVDDIVRVTFSDDGSGMTEDVIRNVFLSPGETTKKYGDMTGGFGTARIMLCFSQVRYSVITNNIIVEGDGSEYTCQNLDDIIQSLNSKMVIDGDDSNAMKSKILSLKSLQNKKGCIFEIDIDPNESSYSYKNMNSYKLRQKLNDYLSMSQIPCEVYINGELSTKKTKKGKMRKELFFKSQDGIEYPFATVHTSEGDKAEYKGEVIIRVNGATMYSVSSNISEQVIVEILPEISRHVLTDNRDSLKSPFSSALYKFLSDLEVNNMTALKQKQTKKHIEIKGQLGNHIYRTEKVFTGKLSEDKEVYDFDIKNIKEKGIENVKPEIINEFIDAVKDDDDTFINNIKSPDIKKFVTSVKSGKGLDSFEDLGESLGLVVNTLKDCVKTSEKIVDNIHNVHIQIDNTNNKELLSLSKRYSPDFWRKKGESGEGRGLEAHMLLIAWTSFCKEAIRALEESNPHLVKEPINFSTGWYFGESEERYNGIDYVKQRTEATHQQMDDGKHVLLLNPVLDNLKPAFSLQNNGGKIFNDKGEVIEIGLQGLEALAVHEVAHIFNSSHNEYFASLLTSILSSMQRGRARREMFENINMVRKNVYGKGEAIVQNADLSDLELTIKIPKPRQKFDEEPRPSEVLMAHSFPATMGMVGLIANTEEDKEKSIAPILMSTVSETIIEDNNVKKIDSNKISSLEEKIEKVAVNNFDIDILDLDMDFNNYPSNDSSKKIIGDEFDIDMFKI